MPCPNIATPGVAFSTMWYVEQVAHAALSMNVSMSAGSTDSAMSISEVHIIVPRIWWMRSQMAFACGFSIVVGLCFMPYELHIVSKCNLNSEPLSHIKYWHLGYLHNQNLLTNWLVGDLLVDPQIPGYGQTIPRSSSCTHQHHLNVAWEPTRLS